MKINSYNNMSLEVLDKTPISRELIKFACDMTMKKADDISDEQASQKLLQFIISADHMSLFEHCHINFLARGISRSLLAQITRQRTFKFTSASQHYQDYRDYPITLRPEWDKNAEVKMAYRSALQKTLDHYIRLIDLGEKPEEARQVLPNACTVNLIITADMRNLINFFRTRTCYRNVEEMVIFADKLLRICTHWVPEIFNHVGAPCFMDGKCNQGHMSCKKNWTR